MNNPFDMLTAHQREVVELLDNPFDRLTARQREVVELLAQGLSSHEIAKQLGISVKTYDSHRGMAMRKLGVENNVKLALLAIKYGLVTVELA